MSDFPPSPSRWVSERQIGGYAYRAAFYPGFVRSVLVNDHPVYTQDPDGPNPFVLPASARRPWANSVFEMDCGKGYRFSIQLEDPQHVVASIQVTLRNPDAEPVVASGVSGDASADVAGAGGVSLEATGDVVTILNSPMLCPPNCPE